MENGKNFSKRIGLAIFTGVFFATLGFLTLSQAEAHPSWEPVEVIGEDLPTNISGDFEIASPKSVKVSNQIVKSSSRVKIETQSKVCYVHVLEQQGSPAAQTVKVCE